MAAPKHRINLSDDELELIVSALHARMAMMRGDRLERMHRLAARLEDVAPGNPYWRLNHEPGYQVATVDAGE